LNVTQYIVREAVLVPGTGGSNWRVTFVPARATKSDEIVVMIPPATLGRDVLRRYLHLGADRDPSRRPFL